MAQGITIDIDITMHPTLKAYRVRLYIASGAGVVVTMEVIDQPGFAVMVLAWKTQVKDRVAVQADGRFFTEGVSLIRPSPEWLAAGIGKDTWRAQTIGGDVADAAFAFFGIHHGHWNTIHPDDITAKPVSHPAQQLAIQVIAKAPRAAIGRFLNVLPHGVGGGACQ